MWLGRGVQESPDVGFGGGIEHDYRELKTGLGLSHFEGRSFTGWHRHTTLVTAAHLFITRLRLTNPKAAGAA